jgi:hypothetical protein
MSSPNRPHDEAFRLCVQAIEQGDFQAAQVYATLSLEEAVRDMTATIARSADKIARD